MRTPLPDIGILRERIDPLMAMRVPRFLRRLAGERALGAPALFAIGLGAVGSSLYFVLGVVAGRALGLTPLVFVAAGAFFVVTMMSYVEGATLHPERGGASSLARYAFDELWSFVAGWAILLDYLIVVAIASFSIAHYLAAFWGVADDTASELVIAAGTIGLVGLLNVRGLSPDRLGALLGIGLLNLLLLFAVIAVGLSMAHSPHVITDSIHLGSSPKWDDVIFAAVVATVAVTGVEGASGFAAEVRAGGRELARLVRVGTVVVGVVFIGISIVALLNVPVANGATALGGGYEDAPLLGVVSAFDPSWVRHLFRYLVGGFAALVLFEAANGGMLGLSRLSYALATNGQIPSGIGKLHPQRSTPYIAIAIACVLAFGLVLSRDIEFLTGIFAFGAMLAFLIAHLSLIVLRFRERERPRPFRIPFNVSVRGAAVPLPAVLGALTAAAAWISVLVLHTGARIVGLLWMVAGLTFYVGYRRVQGKDLTRRYAISEEALKEAPEAEYGSILVPVFGEPMDDDIVGTAGRLASEQADEGEGGAMIEAIYVVEMPMSLPLDARVPDEKITEARRALARAKQVGEEYEGVEVATASVRARTYGQGIVEEARRRGVEAIVLAAEEPTRMRGGRRLGGRAGPRNRAVGETTRYVLEKSPCTVILTAPPAASDDGTRAGVAP